MSKRTTQVFQWLVALALVALFLTLGDRSQLRRLPHVSWPWLCGVVVASAGLVWSAAARWRMIAIHTVGGGSISLTRYVYYFLLGRVLGFVLPAEATDVGVRALALKRSGGVSLAGAAYTVLLDRLLDLAVLVWLVVPALLHLSGQISEDVALGMALAGILLTPVVIGRRHGAAIEALAGFYTRIIRLLGFLPWMRGLDVPEFREQREDAGPDGRLWASVYLLSIVKLVMVVARFYFVARALAVPVPLSTAFICVPLAQVAAVVAVTPGGLGILEAGWYGILVWAGVAPEETVLLVVGWRLYTLASLLFLLLGLRGWEAILDRRVGTEKRRPGD